MLALPQVNDQYMVAKRIAALQLGKVEKMEELTADTLRRRVNELMMDGETQEKCRQLSEEMKNYANLDAVVKKLTQYSQQWKEKKKDGIKK